jgi:glycosyltransferase involved in cell wall biosynthesis
MLRYTNSGLRAFLAQAVASRAYDSIVCDFLAPAANFPQLDNAVLFQHNVETVTVRRLAEKASDPLSRAFFGLQAQRMFAYEKQTCLRSGFVAAVSETDAQVMRSEFGLENVMDIGTGVNLAYFSPQTAPPGPELVFIGSMDYLPNIDGIAWFVSSVLPLIWRHDPSCRLAIVGRDPAPRIQALASDPRILITGTVPDVRPYLWGSRISIVPLHAGGGTRLKIYESMAARTAMVSTSVGAEGLAVTHGENSLLADSAEDFANACIRLLTEPQFCDGLAAAGREFVSGNHSWETVTSRFERILERVPAR